MFKDLDIIVTTEGAGFKFTSHGAVVPFCGISGCDLGVKSTGIILAACSEAGKASHLLRSNSLTGLAVFTIST